MGCAISQLALMDGGRTFRMQGDLFRLMERASGACADELKTMQMAGVSGDM